MKKMYQTLFTLALLVFGVMGANAGERISLQEVPFCNWDGWGADAKSTGDAACDWVIGESTGQPYGSSNVIPYADLSVYSKLIVVATEGKPRFLLNRDIDEGKANAVESEAHLIDNTVSGWSDKYFTQEAGENEGETIYYVDLKQIVKDKGFAHLHAIKGANWANTTVLSMELEVITKAPIGWTNIITNSNMEGDDNSCFFTKIAAGDPLPSEIQDGIGKDGSRGIMVAATDKKVDPWDNQFWFRFTESVPVGTKYRVSFDYKADETASAATQSHAEPGDYIWWEMLGNVSFQPEWNNFYLEGEVTEQQAEAKNDDGTSKYFQSIAFNLNDDSHPAANNYYFDNIVFEVYKFGTTAQFYMDIIKLDFGFDTNVAELVKASGKSRLLYPNDCVSVKVNGKDAAIYTVEGFDTGEFYIFLEEAVEDRDEVVVNFTNPEDAAYRLVYTGGTMAGQALGSFSDIVAELNSELDAWPYDYATPNLVKADPEDGSFNLPNSIKEFKFSFDAVVDCSKIEATLNGKALAANPADGYATDITFVREGDDLATGEYTLHVTKIYGKNIMADEIFGDTILVLNIGKVAYDPDDVIKDMIPDYFAECAANTIPKGYRVNFQGNIREPESGQSGGPRMFDFAAGGDFTKGLYFREGYVEYGMVEGYELALEANKKYEITFNTCMWKDNGSKTRFQIFTKESIDNETNEAVYTQVITNTYNANGSYNAINGSAATKIQFIPETTANYVLRWVSSGDETSDPAYMEIILGKPAMKYIPNQAGIEYVQLLNTALENAKAVAEGNAEERYSGAEYDALAAAIAKYEAEKDGYTSPSAYQDAAADLEALAAAVKEHRTACDDYDAAIKKSIDVERQNKETKFNVTELYAQVVEMNAKYHGTSEWIDVADHEADPEAAEQWQLFYSYDELKDADSLKVAVAELKELANTTSLLFTEGKSAPEGANGGKQTGVAVLFERIRLGIEALKALGVAEDDELIVEANKALTDDDAVADAIKARIKDIVYGKLKNADNDLFAPVMNPETLVDEVPAYDMSVFVKNPNIYKQKNSMNFDEENVPAWVTPEGFNKPGLTVGWGQPKGNDKIAEDVMFQTWGASYRVEQTITDLPAGVYTLKAAFGERNSDGNIDGMFFYAKTSDTIPVEEGMEEDVELNFAGVAPASVIGQAFPFVDGTGSLEIENIVVTDGQLTLGVNAPNNSHTFFNEVRVLLTGAASVDYAALYTENAQVIETGIETAAAPKVRAIELYDLNGRRITSARQGIVLMKKYMSNGTVETVKVVRK